MSFTPGFSGIATNGTTPVTVVSAPSARTQRLIRKLIIQNNDSSAVVATVRHITAGGSSFTIRTISIAASAQDIITDLVLDATTQTITVQLASAVAATESHCTAHYADLGP